MTFIAGVLMLFLVINCVLLILLILVQLPKKDAGAGLAFGGGAADALFGAGSGNALTKITKYATIVFVVLALILGYVYDKAHNQGSAGEFAKKVQAKQNSMSAAPIPAAPVSQAETPAATPATTSPTTIPAGISGAAAAVSNNVAK